MIDFKKNQKKFMAVFSVGLMIAFALPSAYSNYSKSRDVTIGRTGDYTVTNKDVDRARQEWEAMRKMVVRVPDPSDPSHQGTRDVPYAQYQLQQIDPTLVDQLRDDEAMYFLLQREADRMGITVGQDEIASVLANRVPQPDDQLSQSELASVVEGYLKVLDAAIQARHSIRASTPEVRDALSRREPFTANVVEFKAADYLPKVMAYQEAERTSKIVEQYNGYKNYEPTTRPTTSGGDPVNDFSFGYRVPNTVQVQYFGVPFDAASAFVKAKIDEVDAIRFYKENIDRFPATQPFRRITYTAAAPPEGVAAPKPPTTRPIPKYYSDITINAAPLLNAPPKTYKDYKTQVYDALTEKRAAELTNNIINDATTAMAADLAEFKKSPAGQAYSATQPSTAPAVSYPTYEYLQKLALREQEKFGLLPTVGQTGDLWTEKQLEALKDVGKLGVPGALQTLMGIGQRYGPEMQQAAQSVLMFPGFATNMIDVLATPTTSNLARSLGLHQIAVLDPSPVFQGFLPSMGGSFVFRAVRAVPSHPAPQGQITDRLLADARMKDAYALARKDAETFAAEARKSRLETAAAKAGRKVFATGIIGYGDFGQVPIADNATKMVFRDASTSLLRPTAQTNDPLHPIGVFDVKPAFSVFVGEVNALDPLWSQNNLSSYERTAEMRQNNDDQFRFFKTWFDAEDIYRRMRYTPANPPKKKPNRAPQPVEQDMPLDNRFG